MDVPSCHCPDEGEGTPVYVERARHKLDINLRNVEIRKCAQCAGMYFALPLSEWAGALMDANEEGNWQPA